MGGAPETAVWGGSCYPSNSLNPTYSPQIVDRCWFLKARGGKQWWSVLKSASETSAAIPAIECGCSSWFQPIEDKCSYIFTTKYVKLNVIFVVDLVL